MTDRIFVKYKISIDKIEEQDVTRREWVKVADKGNERDGGGAQYDYANYISREELVTKVLSQEIQDEKLNIKAVIKAINDI